MSYNPLIHHRRSIRLRAFDYASSGAYFVTVCTFQREHLFGEIVGSEMRLNQLGEIAREEWIRTAEVRREAVIDTFVVMPNHTHAIVILQRDAVGAQGPAPLRRATPQARRITPKSLGSLVRGFKAATTTRINEHRACPGVPVWQRNYYERILRNERELNAARKYVEENPLKWALDPLNFPYHPS